MCPLTSRRHQNITFLPGAVRTHRVLHKCRCNRLWITCDLWRYSLTKVMQNTMRVHSAGQISMEGGVDVNKGHMVYRYWYFVFIYFFFFVVFSKKHKCLVTWGQVDEWYKTPLEICMSEVTSLIKCTQNHFWTECLSFKDRYSTWHVHDKLKLSQVGTCKLYLQPESLQFLVIGRLQNRCSDAFLGGNLFFLSDTF